MASLKPKTRKLYVGSLGSVRSAGVCGWGTQMEPKISSNVGPAIRKGQLQKWVVRAAHHHLILSRKWQKWKESTAKHHGSSFIPSFGHIHVIIEKQPTIKAGSKTPKGTFSRCCCSLRLRSVCILLTLLFLFDSKGLFSKVPASLFHLAVQDDHRFNGAIQIEKSVSCNPTMNQERFLLTSDSGS